MSKIRKVVNGKVYKPYCDGNNPMHGADRVVCINPDDPLFDKIDFKRYVNEIDVCGWCEHEGPCKGVCIPTKDGVYVPFVEYVPFPRLLKNFVFAYTGEPCGIEVKE